MNYKLVGFDENGNPIYDTLDESSLEQRIEDLEKKIDLLVKLLNATKIQ